MKTTNLKELLKAEIPMWFEPKDKHMMLDLMSFLHECGISTGKYNIFFDFDDGMYKYLGIGTGEEDVYYIDVDFYKSPPTGEGLYFYDLTTGKLIIPGHENFRKALRDEVKMEITIKNIKEYVLLQLLGFYEEINWKQALEKVDMSFERNIFIDDRVRPMYSLRSHCYSIGSLQLMDRKLYKQFDFEKDCFVEEKKCKWPNLQKEIDKNTLLSFEIKNQPMYQEFLCFIEKNSILFMDGSEVACYPLKVCMPYPKSDKTVKTLLTGYMGLKEWDLKNDSFVEERLSCDKVKAVCLKEEPTVYLHPETDPDVDVVTDVVAIIGNGEIRIPKDSLIHEAVLKMIVDHNGL